jgi:hypothetical protein
MTLMDELNQRFDNTILVYREHVFSMEHNAEIFSQDYAVQAPSLADNTFILLRVEEIEDTTSPDHGKTFIKFMQGNPNLDEKRYYVQEAVLTEGQISDIAQQVIKHAPNLKIDLKSLQRGFTVNNSPESKTSDALFAAITSA